MSIASSNQSEVIAAERLTAYDGDVAGVGVLLRAWRERVGISQEALAKRMGHARPGTVQAWEKGRRLPKPKTIQALGEILGVTEAERRAALEMLVGMVTTPPRVAARSAAPSPTDPLLAALAEALPRASAQDRAFLWTLTNLIRERLGLPAIEPSRAPRRVGVR